MLSGPELATLETFLLELNHAAGDVIGPLFRGSFGMEEKVAKGAAPDDGSARGFDPVTKADRDAEAAIRKLVAARYPHHGVIGEEYGEDRPDAEHVWVLDPVDGTRAFVAGLPVWTTLIGLRFQGRPVLGSIGQSFLREIYIGHVGPGARARLVTPSGESALRVRRCESLATAVIASTDPNAYFSTSEREAWSDVRSKARIVRLGCDAYAYAMVAAGSIDLVVEAGLHAWDIDAAIPVIVGAGGLVTDWQGREVGRNGGRVLIAGDRACLDDALTLVARL
ncbi:MAG: histidinol-phosphatase [Deltaproteobacteria bacterium]|nr:histidinol-phosphatase [Deltaproteobacteria bacterium]